MSLNETNLAELALSIKRWGVELGKVLAKDIHARMASGDASGLDASTAGLLARVR